jgi:hypothetical protein
MSTTADCLGMSCPIRRRYSPPPVISSSMVRPLVRNDSCRHSGAPRTTELSAPPSSEAAVAGYRLLTRDASRYWIYFPKLELIVPGG